MFLGAFLVLSEITMKTWLTMIATLAVTAGRLAASEKSKAGNEE